MLNFFVAQVSKYSHGICKRAWQFQEVVDLHYSAFHRTAGAHAGRCCGFGYEVPMH